MTPNEALKRFKLMNADWYMENTLNLIDRHSVEFFKFYPEITDIKEVQSDHIVDWLNHLRKKNNSDTTRRLKVDSINSIYAYFVEDEEIDITVNPCLGVTRPKRDDNPTSYIDPITLIKLRDASKNDLRNRAIFETLLATGMRLSEMANVRIDDVGLDSDSRIIKILKGKGLKPRRVIFNYECLEWLNRYLSVRVSDSPYLFITKFGSQMNRANMYAIFMKYKKLIKVDKLHTHMFRVTFATNLYLKGVPVEYIQYLLGHEDLEETLRYIRLVDEAL